MEDISIPGEISSVRVSYCGTVLQLWPYQWLACLCLALDWGCLNIWISLGCYKSLGSVCFCLNFVDMPVSGLTFLLLGILHDQLFAVDGHEGNNGLRVHVILMTHVSGWYSIPHCFSQASNVSRSSWRVLESSVFDPPVDYAVISKEVTPGVDLFRGVIDVAQG